MRRTILFMIMGIATFWMSSCVVHTHTSGSAEVRTSTTQTTTVNASVDVKVDTPVVEPADKLTPPPLPSIEPEVVAENIVEEVDDSLPEDQPENFELTLDVVPPAGYEEAPAVLPPDDVAEVVSIPPDYEPPQFTWEDLFPPNYNYCPGGSYKVAG